jgi:hypothetical protein
LQLQIRLVAPFSSEDFMKYPIPHAGALAAFLLGACATAAGAAGQNQPLADPADANAPVPSTRYVPALGAPLASPSPVSPADTWKALNKTVASYDSMSLTMDVAEPKPAERATAEQSGAPGTAKTPPDPRSHHPQKEAK